jgi:signal transduction histidine kinase
VIAGFAELLSKRYRGKLDDKAEEFITQIEEGAGRQQHLITDLLEYSRVTTRGKDLTETGAYLHLKGIHRGWRGSRILMGNLQQ